MCLTGRILAVLVPAIRIGATFAVATPPGF